MVSSTGKFISDFKKTKIGLSYTDFVIYLHIKRLQKNNPHWNLHWNPHWTRTGTYTEKYCFGVLGDWLWFHKIQVMMTRMKRTTCMVWWLSLRFQLQRYNKKLSISKFSRISATNPPTKWCVWTGERFYIPPCKVQHISVSSKSFKQKWTQNGPLFMLFPCYIESYRA